MITKITAANADKYRVLFAKATAALRTHDANGVAVEAGSSNAIISGNAQYIYKSDITAGNFVAGELFYGAGTRSEDADHNPVYTEYHQTAMSDQFDANKDYYLESVNGEITSLDEYFGYIQDLMRINTIYTILPLDEEIFEIDANTRQITVPSEFAKNGVSVQGDEISEILYFKIDRYYDMEDLKNEDIFIEWRTPEGVEGVSKPWAIDLESDPGYIIFGWPLSHEITSVPGNITFAVRFYRFEDHALQYSLSTLVNTVTIKPGIALEKSVRTTLETDSVTDKEALIRERLLNSERYDPAARAPEKPKFNSLEYHIQDSAKDIVLDLTEFELSEDTAFDDRVTYYVKNTSEDSSVVSYSIYQQSSAGDGDTPASLGLYTKSATVIHPVYDYELYTRTAANDTPSRKSDIYDVYLTNPSTGEERDAFYRIRAIVEDTGTITYAWLKLDSEGEILNTSRFESKDVYLPTEDVTFVDHRDYYVKDGNNFVIYDGTRFLFDENGNEDETRGADPRAV